MSPGPRSLAPPPPPPPLHPRSFKLRFAARGELGRSHFSAIKPLALPAPVTESPQRRGGATPEPGPLQRVRDAFERGPRDRHPAPLISSHEYGWWAAAAGREGCGACGARLDYRIRDSAWLKERVRVLASDAGYKR